MCKVKTLILRWISIGVETIYPHHFPVSVGLSGMRMEGEAGDWWRSRAGSRVYRSIALMQRGLVSSSRVTTKIDPPLKIA